MSIVEYTLNTEVQKVLLLARKCMNGDSTPEVRSKLVFYNFHQQHSHKTDKFENHLQFRNIFLANLRKRAQFSKHSMSFIRLSGPYVIVTQSSESALVSARPSPIAHMLHIAYTSRATLATQCSAASQSRRQVVSITLAVNQLYQRC
jgi:hypothetical protein